MSDAPEKLRCFIALPIDEPVIRKLHRAQQALEQSMPRDSVRWTSAEQMHLTLMFLGSVPAERIGPLESALRGACAGLPPLTLTAEGIGAFPSLRNPRVIWVGLLGDVEPLQILQQRLQSATASFAQKIEDRPFHPHLTLGRVRENAKRHTRHIGEEVQRVQQLSFGTWQANEVRLMRSQLSPKGSTYTILAAVTLHSVVN